MGAVCCASRPKHISHIRLNDDPSTPIVEEEQLHELYGEHNDETNENGMEWIQTNLYISRSAMPVDKLEQWKQENVYISRPSSFGSANDLNHDYGNSSTTITPGCSIDTTDLCYHSYRIIDILRIYKQFMCQVQSAIYTVHVLVCSYMKLI